MAFIANLYHDEIRSGYLVASDIKKVWNRQLEIWQEVDRICRKHSITYWAAYGTLIGAARHKGFIPWDGDFDLCMMRPEFNRFREVVEDEFHQSGGIFELKDDSLVGMLKLSHSQTTLIDRTVRQNKPQGLAIDIFALDIVDDKSPEGSLAYRALNELIFASGGGYENILQAVREGRVQILNALDALKEIFDAPDDKKIKLLDFYSSGLFNQSSVVAWIQDTLNGVGKHFDKEWFRETIYLPFESIQLPAPVDYDKVLSSCYGDWRTPFNDGANKLGNFHSADIPWREFLQRIDFELMFPKK